MGDESYVFQRSPINKADILSMGIMAADFAPQGRSVSEGEDNHNGYAHQDDLKAIIDFLCEQTFVDKENIGIFSFSFGLTIATGALSRHPDLPVQFLIDLEGPTCPARDIRRGMENSEPWINSSIISKLLINNVIHGGNIYDDEYWDERDALRFIKNIPCPYLRIQFSTDHSQGTSKGHMISIINTATKNSGQWTRCNNNPPNIIYKKSELNKYSFHTGMIHPVVSVGGCRAKYFNHPKAMYKTDYEHIQSDLQEYLKQITKERNIFGGMSIGIKLSLENPGLCKRV